MIEDKQGIAKKNVHTCFYIGPNHMFFFMYRRFLRQANHNLHKPRIPAFSYFIQTSWINLEISHIFSY